MTFPLVARVVTLDLGTVGRDLARAYAANTLGGVLGSLAGGFLLVPALGLRNTLVARAAADVWLGAGGRPVPTEVRRPARSSHPPRRGREEVAACPVACGRVVRCQWSVSRAALFLDGLFQPRLGSPRALASPHFFCFLLHSRNCWNSFS